MQTQDITIQCPYTGIEEIEETTGIRADKMLGMLVQQLGDEYAYRHQPGLCDPNAPEPQSPTLLEQLIVLIDEGHRKSKDKIIDALEHEPIDTVNSYREDIKILEHVTKLLKAMLAWEKSEIDSINALDEDEGALPKSGPTAPSC